MNAGAKGVVRVRVPAKLNLHLAVGPARADGYHELITVFQAVDLYDEVTATGSQTLQIVINGLDAAKIPTGTENLAWQAAVLLAQHSRVPPLVRLDITKAIPLAGGMAGGSADAAATLLACSVLWDTGATRAELAMLAARLGSDVPFPLHGGTALGTGRGELLTPALAKGTYHWVLALSSVGIPAARAYAELDRMRAEGSAPPPLGSADAVLDAARSGDPIRLAAELGNDLQPAALKIVPKLRNVLRAGSELGALAGIVSGSGPTCAFLCESEAAATTLAAAMMAEDVCRSTRVASGPVPGARVLS